MKHKDPLGFRQPYQGIIRNLINNIDICNERYSRNNESVFLVARDQYIEELTALKTWIKKSEAELGYY
tara:strand:+ start:484 stop:687 length:204 start_codon:yes stop_codon:yes gene_type:complete